MLKIVSCISLFVLSFISCYYNANLNVTSGDKFTVGFYNVENLFDTISDPDSTLILRDDFTPPGTKIWNSDRYYSKLKQLDKVISNVGLDDDSSGISLMGICEVENRKVLVDLLRQKNLSDRGIQVIHEDGNDHRGIDVALLYNPVKFEYLGHSTVPLILPGDSLPSSRDQLIVQGILGGDSIYVIVSHWPSKRGGEAISNPKRNAAAALGRFLIDSLLAINNNSKVIYMGDLNDNPFASSVKNYLMTSKSFEEKGKGLMFNPMEAIQNSGLGTYCYREEWNVIDQILYSEGFVNEKFEGLKHKETKIYSPDWIKVSEGKYKGTPFRTYAGSKYLGGYSDHFPVYSILISTNKDG